MAVIMAITISAGCSKIISDDNFHFTIAVLKDVEPFDYEENGLLKGIDIELLQAIASDQGFKLTLVPTDLVDILQGVKEHRYEGGIGMLTLTQWRKENFDHVDPYFYSGISMAVRMDNTTISDFKDMEGKTVSCLSNSTCEDYVDSVLVKRYHIAKKFPCKNIEDAYKMVEDGSVDAIIDEDPMILYHITQQSPIRLAHKGKLDQPFTVLLPKGQGLAFKLMFNLGLKNIKENGIYDMIIDSYLGD